MKKISKKGLMSTLGKVILTVAIIIVLILGIIAISKINFASQLFGFG